MTTDNELPIPGDKRIIDLTYSELIIGLRRDLIAEALKNVEPVLTRAEGKEHPETNLPEGPEDEVNSDRAREIIRSKANPVSIPYLNKLRKKPEWDITGRNIGGKGLPYKVVGRRAMHKVKDLLLFRNDSEYFVKQILKS